ncbi:hypothetical protein NM688_g2234 [Phlebia brevispora]|uniref:Uncharacterized protein n=1 Tax=Phlebia brevispora TaxID=194682 RepID=A0ACC1T9U7_9APHY|nr:hypothetical protein NM688_g2234 [Phlebia brevispora]
MSSPTPSLKRRSSVIDYFSSLPKRTRLPSLRSRKSAASSIDSKTNKRDSFYVSYAVYQQAMAPIILRDPEAMQRMLEAILESPGGKRSLCRLARTCKAFKEPALDLLWRDLDTFVPLLTLFPSGLMKRARRPALGLVRKLPMSFRESSLMIEQAKNPEPEDWEKVLAYAKRVRSISYVEAFNNISQSVFGVFDLCPEEHLLPNLTSLTWKAESTPGLNYCRPFLCPDLKSLTLEMGVRAPKINDFLDEVMAKTQLTSFSFTLHSNLPDNFVDKVQKSNRLQKLSLMAPGSLAARVGRWASSLPFLRNLQLDLSNSSTSAVENFFSDIAPGSGYSTPSSVGGDSGVFSGDEIDFTEARKNVIRLTSDGPRYGAFSRLTQLSLIGEAANIATFLKHVTSPIVQLDLAVEDPPARDDWRDLCSLLSPSFGRTLQVLRFGATSNARFAELIRSTSRGGDVQLQRLTLEHLGPLPNLARFEIELSESAIFHNVDLAHLARVCPSLEIVRLCGQARFPQVFGPPYLTLEGIIPLTSECKNLHTLSVVVNALDGRDEVFRNKELSSRALLRLNVGHSWVKDPLQTAILLSHIAPHLESLKWFAQASRSGVVEAHAAAWQKVQDYLPSLQNLRLVERSLMPKPIVLKRPKTAEKEIDATVKMSSRSVQASVKSVDASVEAFPEVVSVEVEAVVQTTSVEIDATPDYADQGVTAMPEIVEASIDAVPAVEERGVDPLELEPQHEVALSETSEPSSSQSSAPSGLPSFMPSLQGIITLPLRAVRVYTYYMTLPLRYMFSFTPMHTMLSPVPGSLTEEQELSEKHTISMNHAHYASNMSSPTSPTPHENGAHEHETRLADPISPDVSNVISSSTIPVDESVDAPAVTEKVFHFAAQPPRLPKRAKHGEAPKDAALDATRQSHLHSDTQLTPWFTRPILFRHYDMAEPKKQEKDYTKEVDALLSETKTLAESGKLSEAIDKLLVLEKQARNASDLNSTTRLVKEICQLSYDARDYTLLNANIQLLSKKHGQLKAVIQAMVELAVSWLDEIKQREGTEKWLELIETLRSVTEGKIFLETPRARVTLLLAHHHESVASSPTPTSPSPKESRQIASDLLSELQVETYSSMERREKTEFLLEQMRFLIMVAREKDAEKGVEGKKDAVSGGEADWIKVRVAGRKVNEGFLAEKENEDLKLKYYDLMIQYALNHSQYLDAAKYYHKVWETPTIKAEETGRGKEALEHIVYYVVLAPHDNEQSDMLHRIAKDPALEKLELHHALIKCFTTQELMRWPGIQAVYGPHLRKDTLFSSDKLWEDLHTRIIEHNVRIVAKYYTRIHLSRLNILLDLPPKETEETLCRLVVAGTVWARIDRPAGIVNFRQARTAEDVMNDWSSDMSKLLGLVEKTWMGVNAAMAAQSRVKA